MSDNITLRWHPVSELPDADIIVIVHVPDDDEPIWFGFWDSEDECWRGLSGARLLYDPAHWMELPGPPVKPIATDVDFCRSRHEPAN